MLTISNGWGIDPGTIADTRSMPLNSSVNLVGSPNVPISSLACARLSLGTTRIEIGGKARRVPPKKSMPSSVNS